MKSLGSRKDLIDLQRTFADIIRKPLDKNDQIKKDSRTAKIIKPSKKLTPHSRIQLYAQQYWWRIQQSFDEDFESISNILGRKKYLKFRDKYLLECPSTSFTLRNLGKSLPKFTKNNPELTSPHTQLVIDHINYEWAKINSFDAAEFSPLTQADIQKKNFARATLKLQPHVQLVKLSFELRKDIKKKIGEVASNHIRKTDIKNTEASNQVCINLNYYVIHRKEHQLLYKSCTPNEYRVLKNLATGCSLNELISDKYILRNLEPEFLFNAFKDWIALGWIYDIKKERKL